jgi:hypothetical protein
MPAVMSPEIRARIAAKQAEAQAAAAAQQAKLKPLVDQILGQGTTSKWSGEGFGSADANAQGMAEILSGIGITDIKQFGKVPTYEPVKTIEWSLNGQKVYENQGHGFYTASSTQQGFDENGNPYYPTRYLSEAETQQIKPAAYGKYVSDPEYGQVLVPISQEEIKTVNGQLVHQTGESFGNKETGQVVPSTYGERQTGNAWGGTFAGSGNTGFRVQFAPDGTPYFYTTGASSNDLANILGDNKLLNFAANAAAMTFGGPAGVAALQLAQGNSIEDAAKAAAISYIGGEASPLTGAVSEAAGGGLLGNMAGSAATGAGMAALTGGDVVQGALSGAASGAASYALPPTDSGFLASDAKQLAAQGLGESQIAQVLGQYASDPAAALTASMVTNNVAPEMMVKQLDNLSSNTGLFSQTGSDASFAAADALQLQQQIGANIPAIEQNLVASGLDTLSSATAAQQVASNPYVTQEQLANSLASVNDPSLYNNLSSQIGGQQSQLDLLSKQYEDLGFSQQEALNQAMSDMQTNVSSQISTQGEQFQTLLEQYQQLGMTSDEALRQTMSDMQTNTSGMFSDLEQQMSAQQSATSNSFDSVFKSLTDQNSMLDTLSKLTMFNAVANIAPNLFNNQPTQQQIASPAYRPASTTPQYNPEYFQQIQNYYTGYMPDMPRDVATPLQDWYSQGYVSPDAATAAQFPKG